MAYVFNRVQAALAPDDQQAQQQQTNIFDPNASQVGISQSGEQPAGGPAKSSTEGQLDGAPSGGGGTSADSQPQQQEAAPDKRLARNKTAQPRVVEQAGQQLSAAEKGLQDEANSYVQGYQTKDYSIGEGDIEKAIGGDADAQTKVSGRLSEAAKAVDPFDPKTDTDIEDIGALSTDAGLDSLLRRESGPQYSAGEAAFDRMLLGRNADFNIIRSQLGARQQKLSKLRDDWTGAEGKAKEAQAANDAQLKAGQDQVRGYLTTQSDTLKKQQEDDAVAENEARKALRLAGGSKMTEAMKTRVLTQLKRLYKDSGPNGIGKYLESSGVDPAAYYAAANDVTWDMGVDQGEATRWNSIMNLLGKGSADGGEVWSAGRGFGDREGFDREGYRGAVESAAAAANQKADAKAQAAIDKIIAAAKQRASFNPNGLFQASELTKIRGELERMGYTQQQMADAQRALNPEDYYNDAPNWENFLTNEDIRALQPYFREMDAANPYKGKPGAGWAAGVRGDDYRNDLLAILGAAPPAPPPVLDEIPTYNDPREFNEDSNYNEDTSPDSMKRIEDLDEATAGGAGKKAIETADQPRKKVEKEKDKLKKSVGL